jgi:hypothetical protein
MPERLILWRRYFFGEADVKLSVIALSVAMVAMAFGSAGAVAPGSIGIYADLQGTSCNITAPLYVSTDFYILAMPDVPGTFVGVNGEEFRVIGLPATAGIITVTPNPLANVILGSPLDQGGAEPQGVNIAWPNCQLIDGNGIVLLYTISIFVTAAENAANLELELTKRRPSTNEQNNPCPLINNCNFPFYTAVCIVAAKAFLNHTSPGDCVVAVQQKTWGEVKSLYN